MGVVEAGRRFGPDDFARTNWNLRRFLWMPGLGLRGIQRLDLLRQVLILSGSRGGRRLPGLRQHPPGAPRRLLRGPAVAGHHRLEAGTGPLLRPGPPHAGAGHRRRPTPRPTGCWPPWPATSAWSTPTSPTPIGVFLGEAGEAGARPVLRRRRAGVRGLQAVRRLHGRLPLRGEEHPRPQLPVPGRGPRGPGVRRARRGGCGRGGRPLPGHHRAPRGLGPQAAPHLHRRPRGLRRRGAAHHPPAAAPPGGGAPPPPVPAHGLPGAHQLRVAARGRRQEAHGGLLAGAWPSPRPSTRCPTPASSPAATPRGATSWG